MMVLKERSMSDIELTRMGEWISHEGMDIFIKIIDCNLAKAQVDRVNSHEKHGEGYSETMDCKMKSDQIDRLVEFSKQFKEIINNATKGDCVISEGVGLE